MKPETLQLIETQIVKLQAFCRIGKVTWPKELTGEMERINEELIKAIEVENGPSTLELECYERGDKIRRQIESSKKYG